MGEFVYVWGQVALKPPQVTEWKKAKADPAEWTDWPSPFASNEKPQRVSTLLKGWTDWNPTKDDLDDVAVEFLRIEVGADRIRVRGRIDEEMFREMAPLLGALVRKTASFGGAGDITFEGMGLHRITVGAAKSTISTPTKRQAERAADLAALAEIESAGPPPAPPRPGPTPVEAEVRARVLAAVAEVKKKDDWALRAVVSEFNYGLMLPPKDEDWLTGVLLECLGVVAPDRIEALACDFLACATDIKERQRAYCALGYASSERSVDLLVEAMLAPVPKGGAFKSDHLGANWGLRRTKVASAQAKVKAAIARWKKLPKKNADVGGMLDDVAKILER